VLAEGEFQAAQRLADASRVLASEPTGLQLRYLQTLAEVAGDKNSTILFPVPIDILRPFYEKAIASEKSAGDGGVPDPVVMPGADS
nr:hypothetical protein [Myxococcota bacterium]